MIQMFCIRCPSVYNVTPLNSKLSGDSETPLPRPNPAGFSNMCMLMHVMFKQSGTKLWMQEMLLNIAIIEPTISSFNQFVGVLLVNMSFRYQDLPQS